MSNLNTIFNLFANCIPVKGDSRSIICDIHRNRFRYIPNALFHILSKYKKNTIAEIKTIFFNEYDEEIDSYFTFMEENEFGFFCEKSELKIFPQLNLKYDFPAIITNSIMDFNPNSTYDYRKAFSELEGLGCSHWQLRFFGDYNIRDIFEVLMTSKPFYVASIHLILPFNSSFNKKDFEALYIEFPISQIDIFSVPEKEVFKLTKRYENFPFNFHSVIIHNESHCGQINFSNFQADIVFFSEAKNFNSCLNRKIGLDVNGEIKNCPSMKNSFGNIAKISLLEAIENSNFKELWNIKKDTIRVCKGCEFRYICTDCRAYIETPNDIYSKPLKCGYDPCTNEWKDWSISPLKKEAIDSYNLKNIISNPISIANAIV